MRAALTILLLALSLSGCAPRPPSWPPFPEELSATSPWYVNMAWYQQSAHGSLDCLECHDDLLADDALEAHPDPAKLAVAAIDLYDYSRCESCHPQEYGAYLQGVHAEAMGQAEGGVEETPAPNCGHCHNAHYETAQTRAELLVRVPQTCGNTCHPEAWESYEHNYHGKAASLGYAKTAICTDCHGAHQVLALFEADEAMPACRRCHPEASDSLVGYRIHAQETLDADPSDPRASEFRLFFWVKLFFTVLVVGVLGFFYAHTGLWFLRSLHERLRRRGHG